MAQPIWSTPTSSPLLESMNRWLANGLFFWFICRMNIHRLLSRSLDQRWDGRGRGWGLQMSRLKTKQISDIRLWVFRSDVYLATQLTWEKDLLQWASIDVGFQAQSRNTMEARISQSSFSLLVTASQGCISTHKPIRPDPDRGLALSETTALRGVTTGSMLLWEPGTITKAPS